MNRDVERNGHSLKGEGNFAFSFFPLLFAIPTHHLHSAVAISREER